ncbi:MAG: hypothetical protein WCQ99_11815 [Pseudomonadota bacterium]
MPQKLNNIFIYFLPGFFGSLAFFYVPQAAGGYRIVKWAFAGFLLFSIAVLLFRRVERLCLPSNKVLLTAAALFPISLAFSLFSHGMDIPVCLMGISRYCVGLTFSVLVGFMWSSFDQQQKEKTLFYLLIIAALSTIPLIISFAGMYSKGYLFEPDISGTFGNPNWAGGYFVTAIPFALYFLVTASGNIKKLPAGLSFIMVLAGLAASVSKSAILTAMLILPISLLALYNRPLIKKTVYAGVGVFLFFIIYFKKTLYLWLEPRLFIWRALLITMRENLFFGNGALQALRNIEGGLTQLINGDINSANRFLFPV